MMDPFNLPRLAQLLGVDPTGVAGRIGSMLGSDPTGLGRQPYGSNFYNPTPAMTAGFNQQMAQLQAAQNAAPVQTGATPIQQAAARAGLQGPPPPVAPTAPPPAATNDRATRGRREGIASPQAIAQFQGDPGYSGHGGGRLSLPPPQGGYQGQSDTPGVAMGLGGLFGGTNPNVSATNPNIDLRNGTATQRMPGQPALAPPANGDWRQQRQAEVNTRDLIRAWRDQGWQPFGAGVNGLGLTKDATPDQLAGAVQRVANNQPAVPPPAPQDASTPPPGVDMGFRTRAKQMAQGMQQGIQPLGDLGAQIRQQVQNSLAQSGININLMGGAPPITNPTAVGPTRHQRVPMDQTQQPPTAPPQTPPTGSVDQQATLDKRANKASTSNVPDVLGDPSDDRWSSVNQWDGDIVKQADQAWQDAINAGEIAPGTPVDPALYSIMKAHIQIESGGDPNATNAQGAYGLGQLTHNAVHANEIPWNDVYNPDTNLYWVGRELISRYADPNNPNGWVGASMGYFSGSYQLNGTTDKSNGTTDSDYYSMMQKNLSEIEAAAPANQTPLNRQAKQVHDINDLGTGDTTLPIDQTVNTHNTKANALLDYARQFVGYSYTTGATRDLSQQPQSFDCSSFVRWVYYHVTGQTLGPTTYQQINQGTPVSWDHMKPGDLVFFDTWTGDGPVGSSSGQWGSDTTPDTAEHVGIYLGNGKMINALNPDEGVKITDLNTPYWEQSFVGARRLDW